MRRSILLCIATRLNRAMEYSPHLALRNALGGEPTKSVPIEAYAVTRAHRRDCHTLLQDQRMLDVSIELKSVRLQVRAIRAGREQVHL
jgi:hypothetical protein